MRYVLAFSCITVVAILAVIAIYGCQFFAAEKQLAETKLEAAQSQSEAAIQLLHC